MVVNLIWYILIKGNLLNHTIEINGVNYGNDWKARVEIEKLFGVLYYLNVCYKQVK